MTELDEIRRRVAELELTVAAASFRNSQSGTSANFSAGESRLFLSPERNTGVEAAAAERAHTTFTTPVASPANKHQTRAR